MQIKINDPTIRIAEDGITRQDYDSYRQYSQYTTDRRCSGAIRRAGGTDITVGGNLTTRYITKPLDQLSIWQPAF